MKNFQLKYPTTLLAFSLLLSAPVAFADGGPGLTASGRTGGSESIAQASGQDTRTPARQDQPSGQMSQSGQSSQSGAAAQGTTTKEKAAGMKGSHPVVYMLVPIAVADTSQAMKNGCWAKFYDDQNYGGDTLTLTGPVDMPNMTGPFGIDWKGKISSAQTGPKANVLIYDNEDFKDLVATIKPGQKVPDLSKKMGFFDEFSSIKISCTKT